MKKVLVAMSGGVDSTAAALILKNGGYDVTGVTLLLSDNEKEAKDAETVAKMIGIPHVTLDLKKEFEKLVKKPFIDAYIAGETPNPCVICNKRIKFGLLGDYADENGFDFIATGHYVGVTEFNGHKVLRRAGDGRKDQSYVLWQLSEDRIAKLIFPLSDMSKEEIRKIAASAGLPNAEKKDSQDICFIPDGDYAAFIEKTVGATKKVGDFVDVNGNIIGRNNGIINFTIGQRKGLGMGFGEPMYVLDKDVHANTVTLGTNDELFKSEVTIRDANISEAFDLSETFNVKIRYSQKSTAAKIYPDGEFYKIKFEEPVRAPAKGQSAVIYFGDLLAGGGFII